MVFVPTMRSFSLLWSVCAILLPRILTTRPQSIFEPRVVEFDRKRVGFRPISSTDVTEEIIENQTDHVVSHGTCASSGVLYRGLQTQAMIISTQHLLPSPPSAVDGAAAKTSSAVPSQGGRLLRCSQILTV